MLLNKYNNMYKNKLFLIVMAIFCLILAIGSVSASEYSNSSDNLSYADDSQSIDELNAVDDVDSENVGKSVDSDNEDNLSASDNNELLSQESNSSKEILSSSVSVSSGHTYKKLGYTFKVSANQYKKIREAINMGKKQKFLDWGFKFKVKTNKVIKVKVVKSTKKYYKKVRYEGLTRYPYKSVKLANLKNYYNNGWKKYSQGFESVYGKSSKYLGYNYVKLKKVVKKYKTVSKRVYAIISYVGKYDYDYGEHAYFPWVSFDAIKSGYKTNYLDGTLLM